MSQEISSEERIARLKELRKELVDYKRKRGIVVATIRKLKEEQKALTCSIALTKLMIMLHESPLETRQLLDAFNTGLDELKGDTDEN